MPNLTDAQLQTMLNDSIQAKLAEDADAIMTALHPLEDGGDYGDAYLLVVALIHVVQLALPPMVCPTHGPGSDCSPFVGIGIVAVDADTGQPIPVGEDGDIFGSVTPEIEQQYPDKIAYTRMLVAELNNDAETSVALWHAAIEHDYADRILFTAIDQAADALRNVRSSLQ